MFTYTLFAKICKDYKYSYPVLIYYNNEFIRIHANINIFLNNKTCNIYSKSLVL